MLFDQLEVGLRYVVNASRADVGPEVLVSSIVWGHHTMLLRTEKRLFKIASSTKRQSRVD